MKTKLMILTIALCVLLSLQISNAQSGTIYLKDFDLNPADASPALQAALDHMGTSGATKLVVDGDRTYKLATPVARSFAGLRSDVVIEGTGSGAIFLLASGSGTTNLRISGLSSITLRGIFFAGTPGNATDAKIGVELIDNINTILDHVGFYGFSTIEQGGAAMRIAKTDLTARNLRFPGSNGYGFLGVPVLLIEDWSGVNIDGYRAIDYGVLNAQLHSKNAVAGATWIHLKNPYYQSPAQGIAKFRNGFLDEGVYIGILSEQTAGYDAIVEIDGLGGNISNTELGQGVAFKGTKIASLRHAKFGFTTAAKRIIASFEGVWRAELDGVIGTQEARIVTADFNTKQIRVKDSEFDQLISHAHVTKLDGSDIRTKTITGRLVTDEVPYSLLPVTGFSGHATNDGSGAVRTYWIVAVDAEGRRSPLSAPFNLQKAWGVGQLNSPNNFVHNLSWTPVPGAVKYEVLRDFTNRLAIVCTTTTNCQDRTESYSAYSPP
jgi:hypothetical protein